MAEYMHQWAGKEDQHRKPAPQSRQMQSVLDQKIESRNAKQHPKDQPDAPRCRRAIDGG
jgi:hypothetical protein